MNDIQITELDGVVVATINRPARLNACRTETYAELADMAARFAVDASWRALVLTGAGRAFCAGQDLDDIPLATVEPAELGRRIDTLQEVTRRIVGAGKPTIAAINGPAVGFGLECTLAFDLRVAVESAYFLLPELARGLFHTNGTYHYLARLVGSGVATDMILTGRQMSAQEALQAGLVSRLVAPGELLPMSLALARSLAAIDTEAFALARAGLRACRDADLEATLAYEARACLALLTAENNS